MLKFEPEKLIEDMKHAISILKGCNCELGDWYDLTIPDFNPSEYDDEIITYNTEINLWLPEADDSPAVTIGELIELSYELESAEIENNTRYISSKRILQLVEPVENTQMAILGLEGSWPNCRLFEQSIEIEGTKIKIGIVNGFTPFAILLAKNGDYGDIWPVFHEEDYFVEIEFDGKQDPKKINSIMESYLFELNSSSGLIFRPHVRPVYDDAFDYEDQQNKAQRLNAKCRLRPVLSGKGIPEVCSLFNRALSIEDVELRLFSLVKTMEFITPTVLRKRSNEEIRQRLFSSDALDPDAEFIKSLVDLIESHRESRKDSVALRLTIVECCDPNPLAKMAPKILKKTCNLVNMTGKSESKAALEELANCLSATRNQIAHAKSNFVPTGRECPTEQLPALVECVRIATIQAIRWFSTCPEALRIIGN
jgi:hypothetical protein